MNILVSSKHCDKCNKDFELHEMNLGREHVSGGKRIFLCCPICGTEIKSVIIDDEGGKR